jgi:hypothetical protein
VGSRHFLLLALAALLPAACSRDIQNEAAVRQGVMDYLSARRDLNLSQMQVDVSSVSFRQNEADVTVSFRPKGGQASSGMQMRYTLERRGNRWVVKGRGTGPHGQMPAPTPGSRLPAGHPPIGPGMQPGTGK